MEEVGVVVGLCSGLNIPSIIIPFLNSFLRCCRSSLFVFFLPYICQFCSVLVVVFVFYIFKIEIERVAVGSR